MRKENYIYLYNDSFISLLNLIIILLSKKIIPYDIKDTKYQANLFDQTILLNIEDKNIIDSLIKKFGNNIFNIMYNVYISNNEKKELIIYYFFKSALKYKDKVIYMRNLKCVSESIKISKYVTSENHKYKGFVRFKEMKNKVLYAEIEPVNDILFKLSRHFSKRLKNEYWIIKDVGRNILSIYDKKMFYLVSGREFKLITNELSDEETNIESMWKLFYNTIGIQARKNDRCRMSFMPKRYWKYIIEMSDKV